jgi:hypothetical protein
VGIGFTHTASVNGFAHKASYKKHAHIVAQIVHKRIITTYTIIGTPQVFESHITTTHADLYQLI